MDPQAFVKQHLPPAPARVLEVGCGRGRLARAIADAGIELVAIDPNAPEGEIFRRVPLEEFSDPEPFDCIVAIRALHHIPDLERAMAKIEQLLRPGGRLLIHEHAWERLDRATARWYLEQRAATDAGAPPTLEKLMREWTDDHDDLHTSATMLSALGARFAERYFAWTPYLYGELVPAVTAEQEQALIDAGTVQATGFHYVGERPDRTAHAVA